MKKQVHVDIELELGLARNMLGQLSQDVRRRLQAVVDNPTVETWDDASGIILRWHGCCNTLWQAVISVDPTFTRYGRSTDSGGKVIREWERIPDRELLLAALRFATH